MQRRIITIPPSQNQTVFDWNIDWREQSSGTSVAGRRNININSFPRWIGNPSFNAYDKGIGAFRAHILRGRGMTGVFRITMLDRQVFCAPKKAAIQFSDGTLFADGTGFADEYTVRCDAGASRGDEVITVNMDTANGPISQGQVLSYDDFPFAVTSIIGSELEIEMPLRSDIPAGALIQLQGRGLFEMVSPMQGNPAYSARQRLTSASMQLQEWLR